MQIKEITLLSEDEYVKYKQLIPVISQWWWLKTPYSTKYNDCVRVVSVGGNLGFDSCYYYGGGVRPALKLNLEPDEPMFWHKPESLIGSKILYNGFYWTVLDVINGELYVLCDESIVKHCFNVATNVWEDSELKTWLVTEGLRLINA